MALALHEFTLLLCDPSIYPSRTVRCTALGGWVNLDAQLQALLAAFIRLTETSSRLRRRRCAALTRLLSSHSRLHWATPRRALAFDTAGHLL